MVTGQLFLPELVVFNPKLWLKGFTLGFPGSNIQSFMISVQDLEKFLPLLDPKICKWLILVWEFCPDRTLVWFPKSTKVKLITCFHDSWIYEFCSRFFFKLLTFWKGHKIWKNLPLKIWRYSVVTNFKWKIFSNLVFFSECPNFFCEEKSV